MFLIDWFILKACETWISAHWLHCWTLFDCLPVEVWQREINLMKGEEKIYRCLVCPNNDQYLSLSESITEWEQHVRGEEKKKC